MIETKQKPVLLKDALEEFRKLTEKFSDIAYGDKYALKVKFISNDIDPDYVGEIPFSLLNQNEKVLYMPPIYMHFLSTFKNDISMLVKLKGTEMFNKWINNAVRDFISTLTFQSYFASMIVRKDPQYKNLFYQYVEKRKAESKDFSNVAFLYALKWSIIDPTIRFNESLIGKRDAVSVDKVQKTVDKMVDEFNYFLSHPEKKIQEFNRWSFTIGDLINTVRKEADELKKTGVLRGFRYAILVKKDWFNDAFIPVMDNYKVYKYIKEFDSSCDNIFDKVSAFWDLVMLTEQIERHLFSRITKKNVDSSEYKRFVSPLKYNLSNAIKKLDAVSVRSITYGYESENTRKEIRSLMDETVELFEKFMATRLNLYTGRSVNEEKTI